MSKLLVTGRPSGFCRVGKLTVPCLQSGGLKAAALEAFCLSWPHRQGRISALAGERRMGVDSEVRGGRFLPQTPKEHSIAAVSHFVGPRAKVASVDSAELDWRVSHDENALFAVTWRWASSKPETCLP